MIIAYKYLERGGQMQQEERKVLSIEMKQFQFWGLLWAWGNVSEIL